MATSYVATFSSACKPSAPCLFDTAASQPTGALSTGIGLGVGALDATPLTPAPQYIGNPVAQVVNVETNGNPNA